MAKQLSELTLEQLERAVALRKQIEGLQNELNEIQGTTAPRRGRPPGKGQKKLARGEIKAKKVRRKMTAAWRAKIAAAAKERWAKVKAAGKNKL